MKHKLILPCFAVLSVLLAAYGPMTTFASAQSASDSKLQQLKQKATDELNRRIENYKKTLKSMDVDVKITQDSSSGSVSSDKGSATGSITKLCTPQSSTSPSPSASPNGGGSTFSLKDGALNGTVALPCGLKDKVKSFIEQIIKELTSMLGTVQNTQSLGQMQSLGQNIDSQFGLDQLTQVQAAATQAIESFTGVLENLKSTFNSLQSQVGKMKECSKSLFGGKAEVNGGATTSPSPSASVSASGEGCDGLNLSSADVATQAQNQLDSVTSVITSLSSILLSAVTLLTTLVSSFGSLTGGLGSLGSLGNLGSLSSMLDPSQLTNLTNLGGGAGGLGSITGMLGSFSAITSQLDIANFMSGNALGSLGSLGSLTNLGGLGNLGF